VIVNESNTSPFFDELVRSAMGAWSPGPEPEKKANVHVESMPFVAPETVLIVCTFYENGIGSNIVNLILDHVLPYL